MEPLCASRGMAGLSGAHRIITQVDKAVEDVHVQLGLAIRARSGSATRREHCAASPSAEERLFRQQGLHRFLASISHVQALDVLGLVSFQTLHSTGFPGSAVCWTPEQVARDFGPQAKR